MRLKKLWKSAKIVTVSIRKLKYVPEEIISYQNYHIERWCNGKNREIGHGEWNERSKIYQNPPKERMEERPWFKEMMAVNL